MDAAIAGALAVAAAALIGRATAWRRVELDLRPGQVAIASGLLAVLLVALWAVVEPGARGVLVLFAGLAPLAWIDARRRILPDEITLPLIALGVVFGVATGEGVGRAAGAVVGYLALAGLGALWRRLRGVEAIGLGDAKLLAAIGAFLGVAALPEVAFLAALFGIAWGLVPRGARLSAEIPFGPALALAAAVRWATGPVFAP